MNFSSDEDDEERCYAGWTEVVDSGWKESDIIFESGEPKIFVKCDELLVDGVNVLDKIQELEELIKLMEGELRVFRTKMQSDPSLADIE